VEVVLVGADYYVMELLLELYGLLLPAVVVPGCSFCGAEGQLAISYIPDAENFTVYSDASSTTILRTVFLLLL
jgi:hypothetical protein